MESKLGIVAGGGALPLMVIKECQQHNRPFSLVVIDGVAGSGDFSAFPHHRVKLGKCGSCLKLFRKEGVKEVLFIGSLRRPSFKEIRLDLWSLKVLAKCGKSIFGDDSLLSVIVKAVEAEGFKVIGVHEVLKDILAPSGVFGKYEPDAAALSDIKRGFMVAKGLGELDVGQSVVVQQGMVIGVEAIEGTDALIKRCKDLQRKGVGGILVKVKKPHQEERIDLPTIGTDTVDNAHRSGLQGIAVEAGATLVVDIDAVRTKLDKFKMFMIGINSAVEEI